MVVDGATVGAVLDEGTVDAVMDVIIVGVKVGADVDGGSDGFSVGSSVGLVDDVLFSPHPHSASGASEI